MPRARRYFLPGYLWPITHRCHEKAYLLKIFQRPQPRWIGFLRSTSAMAFVLNSVFAHLTALKKTFNIRIFSSFFASLGTQIQAHLHLKMKRFGYILI